MQGGTPRWAAPALAVAAALLVGLWLLWHAPRYAYHWDELQLARGAVQFDLTRHHPHPPGYYLFVKSASLLVAVSIESIEPIAATRIVAGASAVGWVLVVGGFLPRPLSFRQRAGWWAYLVALVCVSATWVAFATVGLSYASEAVAFTLVLLAIARVKPGTRAQLWTLAGVGFAAGVRPTILPWTLLVLAVVWARDRNWLPWRRWPVALVAGVFGVLAWWGPMLLESGGLESYRDASRALLEGNVWRKSVFAEGVSERWLARFPFMATHLVRALGPALPLLLCAAVVRRRDPERSRDLDVLPLGAAAALATYALVIYDQEGYMMAVAAPLQAWAVLVLARAQAARADGIGGLDGRLVGILGVGALLVAGSIPDSTRSRYRVNDERMDRRLAQIREFDPADTVVVFSIEHWDFGLRHTGRYLPEFASVQLLSDRFFAVVDRETAPYLMERGGRLDAIGPQQVRLGSLTSSGTVRRVVLGQVRYLENFVHPVCAQFATRLDVAEGVQMALFTLPPGVDAWIDREWLVCGRAGLGQAPAFEHGLDAVR